MPNLAVEVKTKELCAHGCGQVAKFKNTLNFSCSKFAHSCPELRRKNAETLKKAYANGTAKPASERFRSRSEKDKVPWSKGKTSLTDSRLGSSFEEIFCKNSVVASAHIRKLVLKENLKEYKCSNEKCSIMAVWNDEPLALHLDHVDGDRRNNELSNLRWLCPNCHSQTETYSNKRGRKAGTYNLRNVTEEEIIFEISRQTSIRQVLLAVGLRADSGNYKRVQNIIEKYKGVGVLVGFTKVGTKKCAGCSKFISTRSENCRSCDLRLRTKIKWPALDVVKSMAIENGYEHTGKSLGLTGAAVRKFLKRNNVALPPYNPTKKQ
jgi:hypothetical protein